MKGKFITASKIFSAIVLGVGMSVLVGWILDISWLKSFLPGLVAMKANTALCFVMLGAGLLCFHARHKKLLFWLSVCGILSLAVFLVGVSTLVEYSFGSDLGIDMLIFQESPTAIMTASPGRMALNTSLCFTLLGPALLFACFAPTRIKLISQILFTIPVFVAFLALLGYIYGVETFYFGVAKFTAMALYTAVAIILTSLSGIFVFPEVGIMKLFSSELQAGVVARRSLVATVVVLTVTDVIVFIGVHLHVYDVVFATALHVMVLFLVFSGLIVIMGFVTMHHEESERGYELRYETLYNSTPEAIMILEPGRRFTGANPSTLRMFRCTSEEGFKTKTPEDLSPEYQPDGEPSGEKSKRMMSIAMEKGMNFFEWKHKRLDGTEFWSTVLLSITELGGRPVLQATVRDIDIQKKQQLELEKKLKELEKFQGITMDREKRIIELKNEIKELKKKQEAK